MKREYTIHGLIALILLATGALSPAIAGGADLEKQFVAAIDELLPGMGAEKIVDRQKSQERFERICMENSGPDQQKERAALCAAIMQRVGPETALPARVWLLRKVEPIGREEVVPGLTELLHDPDPGIRELARRALQNNPVPQAAGALRNELEQTQDAAWQVAILNALSARHDREASPLVARLAENRDPTVAKAAISALGNIADDRSLEALASLRQGAAADRQEPVVEASLRAAERAAAAGRQAQAAAIYEELYSPSQPEIVRIAALNGITNVKGADALPALLNLMAGEDPRMRMVAAGCAQRIPGEAVTRQLADKLATTSPATRILLLDVLGQRGDASAAPAVIKCIHADEADVRIAGLAALRHLGDGSTVEALVGFAVKAPEAERDAARQCLGKMKGGDVDDAILKQLSTAEGRVKSELVRAAAVRFMRPAFEILLRHTRDSDASVRIPVISTIGRLAHPEDLPKVLDAFKGLEGDEVEQAAKDALVQICNRVTDAEKKAQPLIDALSSAEPSAQIVAIRALAAMRGRSAYEAVLKYQQADDAKVQEAAVKAASAWEPVYCTDWVYTGLFEKEGVKLADLLDTAFPPEDETSSLKWKKLALSDKCTNSMVDVEWINLEKEGCIYARTVVESRDKQKVVLTFGSSAGIKVWLNGRLIHSKNELRECKPNQEEVNAKLDEGRNTLMVKLTRGSKGDQWAFSCGLKAPEGGPPPGVKFKAE